MVKRAGEALLTLNGQIVFDERKVVALSPFVPSPVSKVLVDLGQSVTAGQALVTLKSVDLAEAEAEFLEAESRQALAQKPTRVRRSSARPGSTPNGSFWRASRRWSLRRFAAMPDARNFCVSG